MIKKSLALLLGTSLLATGGIAIAQPLTTASAAAMEHHEAAEMTEGQKMKALFISAAS